MPRFSIVLPVLGNPSHVETSLASVLRNRPASSEIIVVHDGNFEDLHELDSEVTFVSMDRRPHLIRMFNEGFLAASGEIIAFIRPGVELCEGWHKHVDKAFRDPQVGMVAPALVKNNKTNRLLASGVEYRFGFRRKVVGGRKNVDSKQMPLGPTSWAGFYRRSSLEQVGLVDEQLDPLYLDMEIALCCSTLGFECEYAPEVKACIESNRALISEKSEPHGLSAERAIRRHVLHLGTIANTGRSRLAFALDIASSVVTPWRLSHAFQKRKARRFNVRDEEFSDEISVRARRVRMSEPASTEGISDQDNLNGQSSHKPSRASSYEHLAKFRKAA